jgi:hypothetical protein
LSGRTIRLATSVDGFDWRCGAVVCAISEPWEVGGIYPAFVTRASDGRWILAYSAIEASKQTHAAMAVGSSPDGPFTAKSILMSPIGSSAAISNLRRATNHGTIDGDVRLGEPYVLLCREPYAKEPVVPKTIRNGIAYFDRPLCDDYMAAAELRHVGFKKVDASFIWETAAGWSGYFTGYGQFDASPLSEYTFAADAPALTEPWQVRATGFAFSPWCAEGLMSTENPAPLQIIQG